MKLYIPCIFALVLYVAAQGFTAHIVGVPDLIDTDSGAQTRITASLILLDPLNTDFEGDHALVDKDYTFTFSSVKDGVYQLLVSSHDLLLSQNRWRVSVDETLQTIMVFDEPYDRARYNTSSATRVSLSAPLVIQCLGIIEYNKYLARTLTGMIMRSPLGFILRSKIYSTMFVICLMITFLPIIIPYISPDLADQFNDLQKDLKQSQSAEKASNAPLTPNMGQSQDRAIIDDVNMAPKAATLTVRRRT